MQKITINNARFYAYHGCMEEEAKIGGEYYINVEVKAKVDDSFATDDLSKTVDYVMVYDILKEEMAIRSKLIEKVAHRIMTRLEKELPIAKSCLIEIIKISPPIGGNVKSVSFFYEKEFDRL